VRTEFDSILAETLDSSDNDMTGALIYTLNDTAAPTNADPCIAEGADTRTPMAVVWGQDPTTASVGFPAIDVGTTTLPIPKYLVSKRVELFADNDGSGTISAGDSVRFVITLSNSSSLPLNSATVTDTLPAILAFDAQNSDPGWSG
jgi:uncharacterized repeat protein (TIGR01451 family)